VRSRLLMTLSKSALASSLGLKFSPVGRTAALDGFAIGALISGAFLLMVASATPGTRPGRPALFRWLSAWWPRRPAHPPAVRRALPLGRPVGRHAATGR
jgi:hypothetical protein